MTLADEVPLILLDVGFTSHHGAKVRRAAEQLLSQLGAAELAKKLFAVDLYPVDAHAEARLRQALAEYVKARHSVALGMQGEFTKHVKEAEEWIRSSAQTVWITGPRLDIPELVIQAVLWKYVRGRSLLNMSFRMKAPATANLLKELAEGLTNLAVAAVGNEVVEIKPGWVPQDAIMAQSNFVNVTYGTEAGEVRAEFALGTDGARVSVMAPGCGFEGVGESGSSLASPYVAAASCLRFLLDKVEYERTHEPKDFWRELLRSTRPIPRLTRAVEGGGMFDAAMLMAPPAESHYLLRRDKTMVALSHLRIDFSCKQKNGTFVEMPAVIGLPPGLQTETTTVVIDQAEDGKFYLWKRTVPLTTFGRGVSGTICELHDFSFEGGTTAGTIKRRAKEFHAEVGLVTW